jgi:pimeloyl-ACP methyl ester carboxylesterase
MSRPELPTPPREVGSTELADGRRMGWAEFGDPDGDPVLWFPGTPGARNQIPHDLDAEAAARRLRIVTIERPGTGDSTDHLYDSVVDFVPDAVAVADDRGIDQFAAVGLSGGGPFVLACAHELPGRMTTGVVLGGVAPTRGPDTVISYMLLLRATGGLLDRIRRPVGKGFASVIRVLGPYGGPFIDLFFQFELGDRSEMHAKRDTKSQLVADLVDAAYRSDLQAPFEDLILFGRHWGFELGDITVPITFWGGTSDIIVPFTLAERQWKRVPGSNLRTMEGRGHFAGYTEVSQVLDVIRSKWPAVRPVRASASKPKKAPKKKAAKAPKSAAGD